MNNFPSVFEAINDLDKDQIEGLLILAKKFKDLPYDKSNFTNRVPIVANSFLESSTRTKNSFAIAIKKLGCHYLDFNTETSSLKKGESLEETLLTLYSQGVDLCIIRTSESHQSMNSKNFHRLKSSTVEMEQISIRLRHFWTFSPSGNLESNLREKQWP